MKSFFIGLTIFLTGATCAVVAIIMGIGYTIHKDSQNDTSFVYDVHVQFEQLDPEIKDLIEDRFNKAVKLYGQKRNEEAIEEFLALIEISDHPLFKYCTGLAYSDLGEIPLAIDYLKQSIRQYESNKYSIEPIILATAYLKLAVMYPINSEFDLALESIAIAKTYTPNDPELQSLLELMELNIQAQKRDIDHLGDKEKNI